MEESRSNYAAVLPRSLVRATDIDALPASREVLRREDYLLVRSPSNPWHYWGNLLLFDAAPARGDAERWERCFDAEFAEHPAVRHRTFAWDEPGGELGAVREELVPRGYELEETVGLIAEAGELRAHPRESRAVVVRALDPAGSRDEPLWDQVMELQIAARPASFEEAGQRAYARARMADLRELFCGGRGAWYVALDPAGRDVLGSCGVVTTGARGRYQAVDTIASHRRQGICSRLLLEAARLSAAQHGTRRFVIAADSHYHALGLYESLGFRPVERVAGAYLQPPEDRA